MNSRQCHDQPKHFQRYVLCCVCVCVLCFLFLKSDTILFSAIHDQHLFVRQPYDFGCFFFACVVWFYQMFDVCEKERKRACAEHAEIPILEFVFLTLLSI